MGHEFQQDRPVCTGDGGAGEKQAGFRRGRGWGANPEDVPLGHPLNKYLVSTYNVVNTVLVTGEAKGNETLKALTLS